MLCYAWSKIVPQQKETIIQLFKKIGLWKYLRKRFLRTWPELVLFPDNYFLSTRLATFNSSAISSLHFLKRHYDTSNVFPVYHKYCPTQHFWCIRSVYFEILNDVIVTKRIAQSTRCFLDQYFSTFSTKYYF